MKRKYSCILIIWLLLFTACSKKATNKADSIVQIKETSFVNPLLSSGPDPWIIRKDDNYYYLNTLGNRIAIWKTKKVSHLRNAETKTVWTPPTSGSNSKNIWAPELHYLNSKWYIYYTAGSSADFATQRIFVLENSSSNPLEGTWTEKGKIGDQNADYFAIDGTVFENQGKTYLIWSGHISATDNTQRLYIAPMSDPWTLSGKRIQISQPDFEWEKIGTPAVNEGPEILRNPKGNVYLIYSASGCWTDDYSLGMMSLKEGGDPLNPVDWTKSSQPVFTKNPGNNAFAPGHNSFFKSVDGKEDWIIYHANSLAGQGCGDVRSPRMQKFIWNTDGTPNFGTPVKINTPIQIPSGE